MVYLGRPYHFKFFKGCLLQILFGPVLNNLTHLFLCSFLNFIANYFFVIKKKFYGKVSKELTYTFRCLLYCNHWRFDLYKLTQWNLFGDL